MHFQASGENLPHDRLTATPDGCTEDRLFGGRVLFVQPADGYRAPVDGLLLAHFAGRGHDRAVDLGAGAGMVSLALLHRGACESVLAVERDRQLAAALRCNATRNGFALRMSILEDDVEFAAGANRGAASLVVANPPFYSVGRATAPVHPRARAARHGDAALPAAPFLRAARALLGRSGRACFVWPADDAWGLLSTAAHSGLFAKRMRWVHARPGRPAVRVLVELRAGRPGGHVVDAPWVLQREDGRPDAELLAVTNGG